MGACKNLIGQTFNRLTVLEKTDKRDSSGSVIWKCECSCANHPIVEVSTRNLKSSTGVKSCGCLRIEKLRDKISIKLHKGDKFGRLSVVEQTNKRTKDGNILWICDCDCGNKQVYVSARDLVRGHTKSCGCLSSYGESYIAQLLQKEQIFYISQKSFNDCINPVTKSKLYFDFYLPDYNICIEYDGIQHFQPTFYTHDDFKERQKRDKIKDRYCNENNIPLLRIKYTLSEEEIKTTIFNFIKKVNLRGFE